MQIGAWKNFEELEESISIRELQELHRAYVEGLMWSAGSPPKSDPSASTGEEKEESVADRLRKKLGGDGADIVKSPMRTGKEKFGVGHGIAHKTITRGGGTEN